MIPKEPVTGLLTFGDYAKDWWTDQCNYVVQERARGKHFTPKYLPSQRRQMELHLLPFFAKQPLQAIDDKMIERWRVWVRKPKAEKGHELSAKSANNLLSNLSVMLDYAKRQHLIPSNPCENVKQLIDEVQDERSIMEQPQVDKIFSSLAYWDNDIIHYTTNALAATTSMRLGEVQALQCEDVDLENLVITVRHSWDDKYCLLTTKNKKIRTVPISPALAKLLGKLMEGKNPADFVFSYTGKKPIGHHLPLRALEKALLLALGITHEQRVKMGLTYHSWRHFANSRMTDAHLSDVAVEATTGHSDRSMQKHYYHQTSKVLEDVREVGDKILPLSTVDAL